MATTVNEQMTCKYRWGETDPTEFLSDNIPCVVCGRIVEVNMSEFALHGICSRDCANLGRGRFRVRSF